MHYLFIREKQNPRGINNSDTINLTQWLIIRLIFSKHSFFSLILPFLSILLYNHIYEMELSLEMLLISFMNLWRIGLKLLKNFNYSKNRI